MNCHPPQFLALAEGVAVRSSGIDRSQADATRENTISSLYKNIRASIP